MLINSVKGVRPLDLLVSLHINKTFETLKRADSVEWAQLNEWALKCFPFTFYFTCETIIFNFLYNSLSLNHSHRPFGRNSLVSHLLIISNDLIVSFHCTVCINKLS